MRAEWGAMARDRATDETGQARAHRRRSTSARGVALAGMVVYHLIWDFAHFGLVAPTAAVRAGDAGAVACRRRRLSRAGRRVAGARPSARAASRRPFSSASPLIAGAAALVTAASYAIDAAEPILFGILHCIAVASLIAALFVAAPPWAALAASARRRSRRRSPIPARRSTRRSLVWLGLGTSAPYTLDWRPLLPWAGVVLIGLGLGAGGGAAARRLALDGVAAGALAGRARSPSPAGTASSSISSTSRSCSACCGALVTATGLDERHAREAYLAACPSACVAHGGDAGDLRQGLRLRRRPRRGGGPVAQRGARRRRRRIAARACATSSRPAAWTGAAEGGAIVDTAGGRDPSAVNDRAYRSASADFIIHACAGSPEQAP